MFPPARQEIIKHGSAALVGLDARREAIEQQRLDATANGQPNAVPVAFVEQFIGTL